MVTLILCIRKNHPYFNRDVQNLVLHAIRLYHEGCGIDLLACLRSSFSPPPYMMSVVGSTAFHLRLYDLSVDHPPWYPNNLDLVLDGLHAQNWWWNLAVRELEATLDNEVACIIDIARCMPGKVTMYCRLGRHERLPVMYEVSSKHTHVNVYPGIHVIDGFDVEGCKAAILYDSVHDIADGDAMHNGWTFNTDPTTDPDVSKDQAANLKKRFEMWGSRAAKCGVNLRRTDRHSSRWDEHNFYSKVLAQPRYQFTTVDDIRGINNQV